LIIDDKESNQKRRKVMAGLTDNEEEEVEETPL
jgi:predicted transcriptional regulator